MFLIGINLWYPILFGSLAPGAGVDNLLIETGDNMLLEAGDVILLES